AGSHRALHTFPTRRSSDLHRSEEEAAAPHDEYPALLNVRRYAGGVEVVPLRHALLALPGSRFAEQAHDCFELAVRRRTDDEGGRSEEHTSELQSREKLGCR